LTPAPAPATQPERQEQARAGGRGQEVYEGVCAGCHGWTGTSSVIAIADLTGARAVNDPTGINVAQVIIHGGMHRTTERTASMPSLDNTYSDADIAAVANYVTARFGLESAALRPSDIEKLRSAD
jgi:mono/diheme cytochrome c family protein